MRNKKRFNPVGRISFKEKSRIFMRNKKRFNLVGRISFKEKQFMTKRLDPDRFKREPIYRKEANYGYIKRVGIIWTLLASLLVIAVALRKRFL